MTDTAVIEAPTGAQLAEQVIIKGDLSKLSEADRMRYYSAVCESLGLNPLTRPFEYISLNGKLTLYATRGAADQLRATRGITITSLDPKQIGDLYVVVATGRIGASGREDSSTGAVAINGLRGEALANAMMKAETKAKRRLTLSLAGLGWTDETEIDSIPGAQTIEPPKALTLAERAAQKAAEVEPVEVVPGQQAVDLETGEITEVTIEPDPKDEAITTERRTTPTTEPESLGTTSKASERCPSVSKLSNEQCRLFANGHMLHRTDKESWADADAVA